MKSVLISIKPTWCCLIASGRKTVEIRKTAPKIKTPFKCYIYCTKAKSKDEVLTPCNNLSDIRNGKVIGEFVCDYINEFGFSPYNHGEYCGIGNLHEMSCVDFCQMFDYIGEGYGFGWHISDVVIYEKPKMLSDFQLYCNHKEDCGTCKRWDSKKFSCISGIVSAPQSWCYVEELTD